MFKTKYEIKNWLKSHSIDNYVIHDDLSVTVNGDVYLKDCNIDKLPLKFRETGYFDISFNRLETLKGVPDKVNGDFDCGANKLTSLDFFPSYVSQDAYVIYNKIKKIDEKYKLQVNGQLFDYENNK